jgi:O-acetyl-ADP-ribose deacetylase (regulator of RNase III)
MYKEVTGNLIKMALEGQFDVIAHGCNCHSIMGAGHAPQMAKVFGCDVFEMEQWGSTIMKLGNIDCEAFILNESVPTQIPIINGYYPEEPDLFVVNAYTQYNYGKNHKDGNLRPADYEAITLCMRKMNSIFKGKHIGLPLIGAGLAGGDWDPSSLSMVEYENYLKDPSSYKFIKHIIQAELQDCNVTIVHYDGTTL